MTANPQSAAQNWRDHRDLLFRFIHKRVADRSTAEDLTQDVLLKAYSRRDTLKASQKLESWLFQIARNAIIDHYRARRPLEQLPADLAEEGLAEAGARRQLARCVGPFVDQLPPTYGQALTLADLQGLPQEQVAKTLGLSLSGAKSRIQRARTMLRQAYLSCCKIEFDPRGNIADFDECNPC